MDRGADGGLEIPAFAYPFYATDEPIRNAVIGAGYRQARSGAQGTYYGSLDSVDWFAVDCHEILRTGEIVGKRAWLGCWHLLTFRGIGDDQDGWEPVSETEFAAQMTELAKLRDSGASGVVTFKDGADRLRRHGGT